LNDGSCILTLSHLHVPLLISNKVVNCGRALGGIIISRTLDEPWTNL
jgi:hypothetical protein